MSNPVPVYWLTYREDVPRRGFWDDALLQALFNGELWHPPDFPDFFHVDANPSEHECAGGVVVISGGAHKDFTSEINASLALLPWCLVIIHADESSEFPIDELSHPSMQIWVQSPRSDRHARADRLLPFGWPTSTPEYLRNYASSMLKKTSDWFASFQATNGRRKEWAKQLRRVITYDDDLNTTDGFAQGFERVDYIRRLARARIAPCPGGMVTPDTLRLWEALEAGCFPLVGPEAGEWDVPEFWSYLLGDHPLQLVQDPKHLHDLITQALNGWPGNVNVVGSWWQRYKRQLSYDLRSAVFSFTNPEFNFSFEPDDQITVIIPTSPIPSHPSTAIIEETIESIRSRLPRAEILIAADGVRPEQEHMRHAYEEYQRRLQVLCRTKWHNVLPLRLETWGHQANVANLAISCTHTTCVLFVEHDTPICGDIPFDDLVRVLWEPDTLDVIRLYPEEFLQPAHSHMFIDSKPIDFNGVPIIRTFQWSQRPHLARRSFYEDILATYFSANSRTMVEDVMHGVCDFHYREEGLAGWERFRLGIYHPEGNIQRSRHLDGRGAESKYERTFVFAYDGETPPGAPQPTAERV